MKLYRGASRFLRAGMAGFKCQLLTQPASQPGRARLYDQAVGTRSPTPVSKEPTQKQERLSYIPQTIKELSSDTVNHLKRLGYSKGIAPDIVKELQSVG